MTDSRIQSNMEDILTQLSKDAAGNKYTTLRKSCKETLGTTRRISLDSNSNNFIRSRSLDLIRFEPKGGPMTENTVI